MEPFIHHSKVYGYKGNVNREKNKTNKAFILYFLPRKNYFPAQRKNFLRAGRFHLRPMRSSFDTCLLVFLTEAFRLPKRKEKPIWAYQLGVSSWRRPM